MQAHHQDNSPIDRDIAFRSTIKTLDETPGEIKRLIANMSTILDERRQLKVPRDWNGGLLFVGCKSREGMGGGALCWDGPNAAEESQDGVQRRL